MQALSRIFRFLQGVYARLVATLTVVWFGYTILKEFSIFDIVASPNNSALLLYVLAGTSFFVVFFAITSLVRFGAHYSDRAEILSLTETLSQRIGTIFSQKTAKPEFIDEKHTYEVVYRHDYLDYSSGDYYSNRSLKGVNSSRSSSSSLIYCESTEYKVPFTDVKIIAFDNDTGEQLRVECLQNPETHLITHVFRIHFKSPIQCGEAFNISYSIFFPNELKVLSGDRELMSISLTRIKKRVGKLIFKVSLEGGFQSVKTFKKKSNRLSVLRRNIVSQRDFDDEDIFYEEKLERPIINDLQTVGIDVEKPDGNLYIIEYLTCKKF